MNLEKITQIVLIVTCIAVLIKTRPFRDLSLPRFKSSDDDYNKNIQQKYFILCKIIRSSSFENINPIRLEETKKTDAQAFECLKSDLNCLEKIINENDY